MTDLKDVSLMRRTKLFRPPAADDYVHRENLESLLEDGRKHPIVVVTAPAGYGKTTQISHWVGQTSLLCAWISLEESHNDLGIFLQHLVSGIDDWSPPAADLLQRIINASELPPANQIADIISAKLDESSDELILVLDDYHEIHDASIHLFIESLLTRLPDSLRVAIISRRTPPIALSRLRSRDLVIDIRLQDLQFDRSAIQGLVKSQTGLDIDAHLLDKLQEITEGWPAGLRMLLLARAGDMDIRTYLTQFKGQVWQIQEYLVEEVLRQLPPNIARHIGITAILGRFTSGLCETLIDSAEDAGVSGKQLVELIRAKGLFCVPLDEGGEWYRYHHLFREILLRQVHTRYSESELRQIHTRAATWLDSEGEIEDAIQHYLLAENPGLAVGAVLRHKEHLIHEHQWRRLDRLIGLLPAESVDQNMELLTLLSWTSGRMGRVSKEIELTHVVRERIEKEKQVGTVDDVVIGQNCAQCANMHYYWGDGEAALAAAKMALDLLPLSNIFARAEATMLQGVSLQMLGNAAAGRSVLLDSLERSGSESGLFQARILIGCCYLSWANGNLRDLQNYATTLLELGRAQNDAHAVVHACWFSGAALYQLNNLDGAIDVVRNIVEQKWWPHQPSYSYCVEIMSMIHSARGEYGSAIEMIEALISQSLESRTTSHIDYLHALHARLALESGDHATASHWAFDFEAGPITAAYEFLVPALGAAKILLESDLTEAQGKAEAILEEHQRFYESTNNTRFLIETLALRAIQCGRIRNEDSAEQLLQRAVSLAEPSGFVRVFVDLGPAIIPLLNRLEVSENHLGYVGTVLAGFKGEAGGQASDQSAGGSLHESAGLVEALSKREKEVLELLARRLTNKEIGERLFIAPETVKRHAHNIFEKLNVSDRRAARAKAIGLGLVSE